ncbi:hypothetical protein H0H81_007841 [Sphagnurus paluster]|uniref:Uncharacterized protein n=1 Tax=Sphagnurus paluster TaxID=117069 RepID=A0A9P7GLU8_9AGAR|nr:hypothetical protein H0H81_007841 [Sphagnurus paluster]
MADSLRSHPTAVFYDSAAGVSLFSKPISMGNLIMSRLFRKAYIQGLGEDGKGWISIEEVFVRLNTTYAPNGKFARLSNDSVPDENGNPTYIGYDAAVCVQLFEPWILEVYNSTTGLPTSTRLVEPGNIVRSVPPPSGKSAEKLSGWPLSVVDLSVSTELDSTNLKEVYNAAHQNSVNQIIKMISFTDGEGPLGYTELSPALFAQARGLADGSNILPYFAGSGKTLARRYNDRVLSSASINPRHMAVYLTLILVLGLGAGFFVPKLPLNVPHRGFEVYSWMAAFHAEELIGESKTTGISRNLEIDEIAQQMGDLKFRYVNPHSPNGD